jgi:arylsulfatase A-like enzyme
VPTIMAAAGVPDVKEQLLDGFQAGDKHFRVHLDGYNQLAYLTGEVDESPRHEFFYYGERDLYAIRYNNWKVHFQTKDDWFAGALVQPTVPRPVNLRVDPFEQHVDAPSYPVYAGEKLWTVMPAAAIVQEHVATFEDFPPRQAPPGFNPQSMVEAVKHAAANRQGD